MVAPQYTASLKNVQSLKDSGNGKAKIGIFTSANEPGNSNPISMRGTSLASPYQESYANYIAEALKQELSLAQKLAPDAQTEISGVLLKNDINVSGFSLGYATVEARFVVKQGGQVKYDQVKTVKHEFPSSFAAAVALPRAVQEYSVAVQKLLELLYTDKAFVETLQ